MLTGSPIFCCRTAKALPSRISASFHVRKRVALTNEDFKSEIWYYPEIDGT